MSCFIKPDFQRNILNISSTLAEFLGCPNDKPTLPALADELKKDYKNVVFLLLDGLGVHPIEVNTAKDSFLRKNTKQVLTSVFPSTTTNATSSLLTNKYPMEHGWFGWCLYFEELGRTVCLFPETDENGEPVEAGFVRKRLPLTPFYCAAQTDRTIGVVVPEYWDYGDKNRYVWKTPEEMFGLIGSACRKPGKQFIYAYCDEPDTTMHRCGVNSAGAREIIGKLNDRLEAAARELPDTLFIVTADHGQVDIDGYYAVYRDEELLALLECRPYMEARAAAFKVKDGCFAQFEEMFAQKYGEDFALLKSSDLIRENYFGGNFSGEHAKLLGDYIAVAKSGKIMLLHELAHAHKGHHASLTEEMLIPLIYFGRK